LRSPIRQVPMPSAGTDFPSLSRTLLMMALTTSQC
jgi:hypothetical protein